MNVIKLERPPIRIAILLNSFPEISEKFLLNHIVGEIIAGIDITVYAAHKAQTDMRHESFYRYNIDERTIYAGVPRSIVKRYIAAPFLFFRLLFQNPKAAFEAIRFHKYQTVAKNMKLLYFGLCFSHEHFDVIHCHFGMNGLIGVYLKTCGFCDRVVTTFHGADINSYPKKYGINVYKTMYKLCDQITANTEFTKSKIIQNGGPENSIVIPVPLIYDEFSSEEETEKIPHSVITVGRLEEKKGYKYSLEAIANVKKTIPDVQYYIIGNGTLRKELIAYAEKLGITENCHFFGACTDVEVRKQYKKCEVFMLPSITASNGDMEGQGLVIQEAQASGIPVISTLHNGIPDGVLCGGGGGYKRISCSRKGQRCSVGKTDPTA